MHTSPAGPFRLGIDIGGTTIKAGVVDAEGRIVDRLAHDSSALGLGGDPARDLDEWIIAPLRAKHTIQSIGVGLPGVLSKDRSTPLEGLNLPALNGFPLRDRLQDRHPELAVRLENDANAAAMGAHVFDASIPETTFGFITIGTGIGSAAIVDGQLFTGGRGNALELGLMPSWEGRILERNIARVGLGERAAEHAKGSASPLAQEPCPSPRMILAAAEAGDAAALRTFAEAGQMLAEALAAFIVILDIPTIYIGGGIAPCLPFLRPTMEAWLKAHLIAYHQRDLAIRPAELGNDAGILGAAALCAEA